MDYAPVLALLVTIVSSVLGNAGQCQDKVSDGYHIKCSHYDVYPNITERVVILDLSHNALTEITQVPYLSLREFNVSNNKIQIIQDAAFKGCVNLTVLDLSWNLILNVTEETFLEVDRLRYLNLSHNSLRGFYQYAVFQPMKASLEFLDISHNYLISLNNKAFNNFRKLTSLDLSYNNLHEIADTAFQGMTSLRYLSLGNNLIKDILPLSFHKLNSLQVLELNNNALEALSGETFKGLEQTIVGIDLSHNKLRALERENLVRLENLASLVLDYNEFEAFPAGALPASLVLFSMMYCRGMKQLPQDVFKGLRKLETVRISFTDLEVIHTGAFDPNGREIKNVDLSNNHLVTISNRTLRWANITNLNLSNNPWNCDCWLSWVQKIIPEEAQNMVCHAPHDGMLLSDMQISDDACVVRGHPDHHVMYILMTVLTVSMVAAVLILAIYWHHRKSASRYKTLHEERVGSVQFSPNGGVEGANSDGSVQYRGGDRGVILRDDDHTLFSID